jgi:hypothetical protein
LRFHLTIGETATPLYQSVGQRALAMVDVGNDGEVSDVVHAVAEQRGHSAGRAVQCIKKRHVEMLTRLPTERLATACWAFILTKSTRLKPAPMLDFQPLRVANKKLINSLTTSPKKLLWMACCRPTLGCNRR